MTLQVSDGPSIPQGTQAPFPTLRAHTHSPPPLPPGDTWSRPAGGSGTLLPPSCPGDASCPGDSRVDESRPSAQPAALQKSSEAFISSFCEPSEAPPPPPTCVPSSCFSSCGLRHSEACVLERSLGCAPSSGSIQPPASPGLPLLRPSLPAGGPLATTSGAPSASQPAPPPCLQGAAPWSLGVKPQLQSSSLFLPSGCPLPPPDFLCEVVLAVGFLLI